MRFFNVSSCIAAALLACGLCAYAGDAPKNKPVDEKKPDSKDGAAKDNKEVEAAGQGLAAFGKLLPLQQ